MSIPAQIDSIEQFEQPQPVCSSSAVLSATFRPTSPPRSLLSSSSQSSMSSSRAGSSNTMSRQGKKSQVSAAQYSPNSSGGGVAREGRDSHKMSRKEKKLANTAVASTMEATVSEQNQRIAQLEKQLKAAMGVMKEMATASNTQETWQSSWNTWSSWWDSSEEPADKRVKEDSQWEEEQGWAEGSWDSKRSETEGVQGSFG